MKRKKIIESLTVILKNRQELQNMAEKEKKYHIVVYDKGFIDAILLVQHMLQKA
jgi:hypothetical protein